MTDPKIEKIVAEVIRNTKEGRLNWHETAKPSAFVAAVAGQFAMELQKVDFGQVSEIVFSLRDQGDRELISISSSMDFDARAGLFEVYDLARRRALRVDDRVDELLAALGRLA